MNRSSNAWRMQSIRMPTRLHFREDRKARNHRWIIRWEENISATRSTARWRRRRTRGRASNRKRWCIAIWAPYRSYMTKITNTEDSSQTNHLEFSMILEYHQAKRLNRRRRQRVRKQIVRWRAKCFHKCVTTSTKTKLCSTDMSAACSVYKMYWWVKINRTSSLRKGAWWINSESMTTW